MGNYKQLDSWQIAMNLVKEIYTVTKKYPREELYSLTSQTRRAAVSVPANIAEGVGRQYKKDTLQFLYISRGSLYELETLLNIAAMVGILEDEDLRQISQQLQKTLMVLNGLINYYKNSSNLK